MQADEIDEGALQRESPYVAWNSPENLSDYLYEFRFRMRNQGKIPKGNDEDYQSLYDYLKLETVLPYAEFVRIANAEHEPQHGLLEHIYRFLLAHHNKPLSEVYLRAVQSHLKPGEILSPHPYVLVGLLQTRLADDRGAFFRLAQDVNIYPSMLQALMDGELVALPALRDKICRHLKCTDAEKQTIQQSGIAYMQSIEQVDARRAFLMRQLAATDRDTPLVGFIQSILYENSPVTREQIIAAMRGDSTPLETVMADIRDKQGTLVRRNYEDGVAKKLARGLFAGSPLAEVVQEMGACRPFGTLLEEYVLAGGRSWGGFIDSVSQDWSLGVVPLARKIGMDVQIIIGWMGNDSASEGPSRPNRKSLARLAENVGLNLRQRDYMYALAVGDLSMGADAHAILREEKEAMAKLPTFHERELHGARVLDRLLRRAGHTSYSLRNVEGLGTGLLDRQRNLGTDKTEYDHSHPKWTKVAHAVAEAICPDRKAISAYDMAMLFVGIPQAKSPAELLEDVKARQITAGEMVRQYRLQEKLSVRDMMDRLGMARFSQDYQLCETMSDGAADRPSPGITLALAREMKLSDGQTQDFLRIMRGDGLKRSQIIARLNESVRGEATFADVLLQVLKEKYQPKTTGDGLGITQLASDLGVNHRDVAYWLDGQRHIRQPDLALKLANIAEIPLQRIADFITVARGKVPSYDPSLIEDWQTAPNPQERYTLFHALRENAKLSVEECGDLLGVNPSGLRTRFLSAGCAWGISKVPVEAMAELLIPLEYPDHRRSFCEWFGAPKAIGQSHVERLEHHRATHQDKQRSG